MQYPAVLPQGAGYAVCAGMGLFFALFMLFLSFLQNRYTRYHVGNTEEFNTAQRSVKPGLISSAITSAWTWAATLLVSTQKVYQFGSSGGFWYAAGACVQILIFSILSTKLKQHAPRCHTYLEIVHRRYGVATHLLFLFFAFATNVLVSSQLLLGGSAVVQALTGMNVYAANWLIPIFVVLYVVVGGLRSTITCDYTHTFAIMILILTFGFSAYAVNDKIGSPERMWELVRIAAEKTPVAGNINGEYLTMKSNSALIFGAINLAANSATVFADQAYWQRAIASQSATASRAYLLGGIAWFVIPFFFSTTLGLSALALRDNPAYPTYPDYLTDKQVSSGLAACAGAQALLGKGGSVAILIIVFMAVTSALSAELVATSSILTFDVFKMYVKKDATPKQLLTVSHLMVLTWAIITSVIACIWEVIGVDLGWLYTFMGVIIAPIVGPCFLLIISKYQPRVAAIAGPIAGLVCGLVSWLVVAAKYYGGVTITATGSDYSTLAGNLASLIVGAVVSGGLTLIYPDKEFNWDKTRSLNLPEDLLVQGKPDEMQREKSSQNLPLKQKESLEQVKQSLEKAENSPSQQNLHQQQHHHHHHPHLMPQSESNDEQNLEEVEEARAMLFTEDPRDLEKALRFSIPASLIMTFIIIFLIPIPMFLSHYVFSKKFFLGYIIIGFIWTFVSSFITCVLPIFESRRALWAIIRGVGKDISAYSKKRN